jgi:hypothetical protein
MMFLALWSMRRPASEMLQPLGAPVDGLPLDELPISQSRHERRHVRARDSEQPAGLALYHSRIGSDHEKHRGFHGSQVESRKPRSQSQLYCIAV